MMNETAYRNAEGSYWKHYDTTPTEKWLELPALNTLVRVQEVGEGTPLLFLHGGPSAGSIFAALASHLKDFRCIVLDRPGCGLSPAIRYSEALISETLPKVLTGCLDALGLQAVNVVGSSFGGACAFWLALRQPERVHKIVLMGCPPFIPGAKMPLFLRLLATPGIGALLCRLPANHSGTMAFLDAMGQQKAKVAGLIPDEFFQWWISLGRNTNTMVNDRELIRHGLTFQGMRLELIIAEDQLQQLSHPTYMCTGVKTIQWQNAHTRKSCSVPWRRGPSTLFPIADICHGWTTQRMPPPAHASFCCREILPTMECSYLTKKYLSKLTEQHWLDHRRRGRFAFSRAELNIGYHTTWIRWPQRGAVRKDAGKSCRWSKDICFRKASAQH